MLTTLRVFPHPGTTCKDERRRPIRRAARTTGAQNPPAPPHGSCSGPSPKPAPPARAAPDGRALLPAPRNPPHGAATSLPNHPSLTPLPLPRLGAVPHADLPGQALQVAVLGGQAGHGAAASRSQPAPPAACPFLCRPAGSDATTHSRKCRQQGAVATATAALPGCGCPQGLPAAPPPPVPLRPRAGGPLPELGVAGARGAPLGPFWAQALAHTEHNARRKLLLR